LNVEDLDKGNINKKIKRDESEFVLEEAFGDIP